MHSYLEAIERATFVGPVPAEETPILLGALRPRMLALAAECCAGVVPYNVTPEHTARAREILGRELMEPGLTVTLAQPESAAVVYYRRR